MCNAKGLLVRRVKSDLLEITYIYDYRRGNKRSDSQGMVCQSW